MGLRRRQVWLPITAERADRTCRWFPTEERLRSSPSSGIAAEAILSERLEREALMFLDREDRCGLCSIAGHGVDGCLAGG
jgi:hypothetical protein